MSTMSVASQVRSENTSLHKRKQADLAPETDCYCNPQLTVTAKPCGERGIAGHPL